MTQTIQGFFARKDDSGHHGRGKTVVRTRAKRAFGPYVIEAVSSAGRKEATVDVDGMAVPAGKVVGGFARLSLYDKRKVSEGNEAGLVGERKWQVEDWREVEDAMDELVELASRDLKGGRRALPVLERTVRAMPATFDELFF